MILLSARIFELTIELFLLKNIDTQFEYFFDNYVVFLSEDSYCPFWGLINKFYYIFI